ncbi:MAG: hypothetical protein OEY53_00425 [Gammaproteobacteria bacterium]|nr:hypothetical protein [Gammaproteobacteria bacterium]
MKHQTIHAQNVYPIPNMQLIRRLGIPNLTLYLDANLVPTHLNDFAGTMDDSFAARNHRSPHGLQDQVI